MGPSHSPAGEQISTKTDAEFLDSQTEKGCIPVVFGHQVCDHLLPSPEETSVGSSLGSYYSFSSWGFQQQLGLSVITEPFTTEGSPTPMAIGCSPPPRFLSLWDSQREAR